MRVEGVQARFGSAMELQFCSCWLILIACLTPWVLIDAQRKCPTNNVASFAVQTPSHLGSDVGAQPPIQSVTLANLRDTSTPIVYDRTSSLKNRSQFSFVHISKCSGASFIQWARSKNNLRSDGSRTFPDFFPKYPQGVEVGNFYDRQRRASWVRLTFLRSPRSHVMSLFKECRFDKWGLEVIETQERNGRLAVPHTGTHMEDFRNWIDYFVARNDTGGLGCYNPWNYQSRAMISWVREPHSVGACSPDFEPSFDGVVAETQRMDWVGLQDFYHESLCLLMFRIEGAAHPYMASCACDADGWTRVEVAKTMDVHEDHTPRLGQHISSHLNLDAVTTAKVDRLTVVDRSLFEISLRGFFAEVADLEMRLGRRIMCGETLESNKQSLAYIADVPVLYELIKSGAIPA